MRTRTITIMVMIVCLVGLAASDGVTKETRERVVRKPSPAARATQVSEKVENVFLSVVVETYLVQVDMDALYGYGVAAVPQKASETVTVPRLVSCLADPDDGRVLDSTRVVVYSRERGEVQSTSSEYVKQAVTGKVSAAKPGARPVQSVRFQSYSSGTTLRVTSYAVREAQPKIRLELSYNHSGWFLSEREDGAPPSTVQYELNTTFEVEDGEAVVVGGKQSGKRGLFLVVRASVVGD